MPIYEFECTNCSRRFDVRRGFNDDSPVTCPDCECEARRIFVPVPIIFKGSGFYVTDTAAEKEKAGKRHNGDKENKEIKKESAKPTGEKTT